MNRVEQKVGLNATGTVHLEEWQELLGTLTAIDVSDKSVKVDFKDVPSLQYPVRSKEGRILKNKLENLPIGTKIGVLKTDLEERIRVRIIEKKDGGR